MKILRIVSDLYPHVVGGLGLHAHEISRWQTEHGHHVKVLSIKGSNNNGFKRTYEVEEYRSVVRPRGNAIAPTMLSAILRDQRGYDIVHAHSQLFFTTNMAALSRRMGTTPLVITNHGMVSTNVPGWIQMMYTPFARWTVESADRIICYTKEDAQAIMALGADEDHITIIRNGIDVNLFTPGPEGPNEIIQIVWSGRFVPGKAVDILVDAFAIAAREIKELRLLLVGDGPQKEQIERQIARLNLEDRVRIIPYVPNKEMPQVYRNSNIFMLTSHYEGVPRTVLESMSCGLPVICTDLPQLRPIVGDCGCLVNDSSTKEFAEAILRLAADHRERRRMGAKARDMVANNYSWDSAMEKTIELYKIVIEEKAQGRAVELPKKDAVPLHRP